MKVLIANTLYPPLQVGGAEISVRLLAHGLKRLDHSVAVVSAQPGLKESYEEDNGIRVYRVPLKRRYWPFCDQSRSKLAKISWHVRDLFDVSNLRALQRILSDERPDILHTNNIGGVTVAIWVAARWLGIPVLHTVRDYSLMCLRSTMFKHGHNCRSPCVSCWPTYFTRRHFSHCVTGVVGVSRFTASRHFNMGMFRSAAFSRIIFNSGDNGADPVPPDAASRPGAGERPIRFGFIGRVSEEKGIFVILEALRRIEQPDWKLNVFGTIDPAVAARLDEYRGDPRIEFFGYVKPQVAYANCDVVLIPSVWEEPLPRVAIEALRQGKRIIASDSGGISELLEYGKVGSLVERTNVWNWSARIRQEMEAWHTGEPNRTSLAGIVQQTGVDYVAHQYAQAYEQVLRELKGL